MTNYYKYKNNELEQIDTHKSLPIIKRLGLLLEQESLTRAQRKQQRLVRQTRFKLSACVQEIDYQHPRNITPVADRVTGPE